MWPTVLEGADPRLRIACEEAFGPVVLVDAYRDFGEAIERVNASKFGLQAAVFTADAGTILRAFDRLHVGAVIHDDSPAYRVDHMPYGGVKESGLGREGPRYAVLEMTEPRLLVLGDAKR